MEILVTGGAGYIGSTICSELIDNNHTPIILDSLVAGKEEFTKDRTFYKGDIADTELVKKIFNEHPDIYATIHLAGFIYVPESVENPYEYYYNNVAKSICFFKSLCDAGCNKIVFSSTASIYGKADGAMVTEDMCILPTSPYAKTKLMIENILEDYCNAYDIHGIALRYFNPIGADPKMRTGAYVKNPSHILGALINVSNDPAGVFKITGVDWPTRDGSGVKDYIHVWDLAVAHLKAVEQFENVFEMTDGEGKFVVINLGTGKGVTAKEMVSAFEKVIGREINKETAPARLGDVAGAYANADTAFKYLGWKAEKTIEEGIADAITWNKIFFD